MARRRCTSTAGLAKQFSRAPPVRVPGGPLASEWQGNLDVQVCVSPDPLEGDDFRDIQQKWDDDKTASKYSTPPIASPSSDASSAPRATPKDNDGAPLLNQIDAVERLQLMPRISPRLAGAVADVPAAIAEGTTGDDEEEVRAVVPRRPQRRKRGAIAAAAQVAANRASV